MSTRAQLRIETFFSNVFTKASAVPPWFGPIFASLVFVACETAPPAMSLNEARNAVAVGGTAFVPPARTITDITGLLRPTNSAEALEAARYQADTPTPATTDAEALGKFYFFRGRAARRIGRVSQALADFKLAARYVHPGSVRMQRGGDVAGLGTWDIGIGILRDIADTEVASGNSWEAISAYEKVLAETADEPGVKFQVYAALAELYAAIGDLGAAAERLADLARLEREARAWKAQPHDTAQFDSHIAAARAAVLEVEGQFAKAEPLWRQSTSVLAPYQSMPRYSAWYDARTGRLAVCLMRQGRLLEAEVEARRAIRSAVSRPNTVSYESINLLNILSKILRAQGRFSEVSMLARATIRMYGVGGASPVSSIGVTAPRDELAAALAAEGHWSEALQEYDLLRAELQDDRLYLHIVGADPPFLLTMTKTGRRREAIEGIRHALRKPNTEGTRTAELRGLLGVALAEDGEYAEALAEFGAAMLVLLDPAVDLGDEETPRVERDLRFGRIAGAYIGLLNQRQGTANIPPGLNPAAEAFRVADAARSRVVQQALNATAARSAAVTPELGDLIRRDQDAAKEIAALQGLLAKTYDGPANPRVVANLQERIATLRKARLTLTQRIAKDFPAYRQLMNPSPVTFEQARAELRADEALITTLVTDEKTYVWAFRRGGGIVSAAVPMGEKALNRTVSQLRKALDVHARTLDEIPKFDIKLAHDTYRALLEPVKTGWAGASSLLVVSHGPLGRLPFALLPVEPSESSGSEEAPFSGYRRVPWLIRRYALTTLPSVSALVTLRHMPEGPNDRRPFVGFGDPYFSVKQATAAARGEAAVGRVARGMAESLEGVTARAVGFRDVIGSQTTERDEGSLEMLPRLPDTADEIRSMARVLGADQSRDVFLGVAANEHTVKTIDLSRYRVVAFATHGLVPGDLDGLTQPALALTAPEVAKVEGDGLLTMEEILGLRLNADWVILSACNTANGAGTGAEAISGLGRAFFYAGARSLLVTHWPVETRAARTLTTSLFRPQATGAGSRAKALQATMNAMIDEGALADPHTGKIVFTFAHPIFWAPFTLVGDGR